MAIKTKKGTYQCSYCYKEYTDPVKADVCRDEHDLIYVPLTLEDIFALNAFMVTKDERILTETLVKQIRKYYRLTKRKQKENR